MGYILVTCNFACARILPTTESTVHQPEESIIQDPNPVHAYVRIYFLEPPEINYKDRDCQMAFILQFYLDRPANLDDFRILNADTATISKEVNEPLFKSYRIHATLRQFYDFTFYPFMNETFRMQLAFTKEHGGHLLLHVNNQSIQYQSGPGMKYWKNEDSKIEVTNLPYPGCGHKVPGIRFALKRTHHYISSFSRVILPVLVISSIIILALFFLPGAGGDKLTLTMTGIVALILHRQAINASLPLLGYLTYFDKFIILCNILNVATALIFVKQENKHAIHGREAVAQFHRKMSILFSIAWIIAQTLLIISIFYIRRTS